MYFSLLRSWVSEVHEEKAYGSDNDYDGGESDDEGPEKLGRQRNEWNYINKMKMKYPKAKKNPVNHIELGSLHHYLPGSYALISSINSMNGSFISLSF